jgi:hypothetical protein
VADREVKVRLPMWSVFTEIRRLINGLVSSCMTRGGFEVNHCIQILLLVVAKDIFVVLQEALNGVALMCDVGQFPLDVHGAHDGWRKHNSKVQRCHLGNVSAMYNTRAVTKHTRFSFSCCITRDKWNTKNCRQSRCARGTSLIALSIALALCSGSSISEHVSSLYSL